MAQFSRRLYSLPLVQRDHFKAWAFHTSRSTSQLYLREQPSRSCMWSPPSGWQCGGGFVTKSCLTLGELMDCSLPAPLPMAFPRQERWNEAPLPSPGDLPDPGIEPASPALAGGFPTTEPPRVPLTWQHDALNREAAILKLFHLLSSWMAILVQFKKSPGKHLLGLQNCPSGILGWCKSNCGWCKFIVIGAKVIEVQK